MYNTEFVYQKEIGKTYNRNFIVNKIGSREKWVGKISKSLEEKGVYFSDLNYRAILANRLGNILNIPMPDYRIVEREKIDNFLSERFLEEHYYVVGEGLSVAQS